jgi:phage FluMu protein Com
MSRAPLRTPTPEPDAECRCDCGRLLARVVRGGIQLKCTRCKRVLLVPVTLARAEARAGRRLDVLVTGSGE